MLKHWEDRPVAEPKLHYEELEHHRGFYALSHAVVRAAGVLALGMKVYGTEHIPRTGRVIIASNHRHYTDPPLMGAAVPERHVTAVAKKEIYGNRLGNFLLTRYGAVPIDRQNFGLDDLRNVIAKLEEERAVLIFPEGTRHHESRLGEFKKGSGTFARRTGALTVPAAIVGVDKNSRNDMGVIRPHSTVVFGEPMEPGQSDKVHTDELHKRIYDLYMQAVDIRR